MTNRTTRSRSALLGLAVATLGVTVAACTGASKSSSPTLASGPYEYVATEVLSDGCWPQLAVFPPTDIPFRFDLTADAATGTISLVRPTNLQSLVPPLSGNWALTAVTTSGSAPYVVGSACTLQVSASGMGTVDADDHLQIDLLATLSANTIATTGTASNCSPFAGTSPSQIPFPELDPPNSGACSFSLRGTLSAYPAATP